MDVMESTRALGVELQKDARFIAYAKAKLALDNDETLQQKIGDFNLARLNLDHLMESEEKDQEKITEGNTRLRALYNEIMETSAMKEYNEAKAQLDKLMNHVFGILQLCFEGDDPLTCTLPENNCTGSCATCSGCH